MKKFFELVIIVLMMSLASNSLFAQNEEIVQSQVSDSITAPVQPDSTETSESSDGNVSEEGEAETQPQVLTMNDLASVVALLNNTTGNKKQNMLGNGKAVFVPLHKNGKMNGHHVCQRLELSVLSGKDKSAEDLALSKLGLDQQKIDGLEKASENQGFMDDLVGKASGFNVGANFGYSVVFVPGYKEGDQLLLNRFGFAYSVGAIVQFDNEKKTGITCDFLGKIGVETGFNKPIGVGIDFLFGGGKTAQTVVDFTNVDFENPDVDDLVITQESLWCGKVGTQLWLRLNFLTKSVNNFDLSVFTRFVYSFRPYSDEEQLDRMSTYDELPFWASESWSYLGVTATYFF